MTPIDKKRMNYLSFFKDGVADALLHGNRLDFSPTSLTTDESKLFSAYYKQGYDFGLTMWNEQQGEGDK